MAKNNNSKRTRTTDPYNLAMRFDRFCADGVTEVFEAIEPANEFRDNVIDCLYDDDGNQLESPDLDRLTELCADSTPIDVPARVLDVVTALQRAELEGLVVIYRDSIEKPAKTGDQKVDTANWNAAIRDARDELEGPRDELSTAKPTAMLFHPASSLSWPHGARRNEKKAQTMLGEMDRMARARLFAQELGMTVEAVLQLPAFANAS